MLNCSRLLSWEEYVVPHLNNYMRRMATDGYSEEYRRGVLKAALARYDEKVAADESGERPLNRPPGYQQEERRDEEGAGRRAKSTSSRSVGARSQKMRGAGGPRAGAHGARATKARPPKGGS